MLMFHPLYIKKIEIHVSKVDLEYRRFNFNTTVLIRIIIIIKACKGQEFLFREEGWGGGNDSCLPCGFSVVIY